MGNLLHRKASKSTPDAIIIEDKLSTDKGKIANAFNKYFATVCVTDENVNQNLSLYMNVEYLNNTNYASFNFEQVENAAINSNLPIVVGATKLAALFLKNYCERNESLYNSEFADDICILAPTSCYSYATIT